jgi:site-specific recombinase XerD
MLEELQRRDYSQSTARIYLHVISDFAKHFRRSPDTLGPEQIRQYQLHLFHRQLSPYTIRQHTAALRFFYFKTLHRNFRAEYIPFPKFRKRLPTILSPEEVGRVIDSAQQPFSPHLDHDSIFHRHATDGTVPAQGQRHRQSAHDGSH